MSDNKSTSSGIGFTGLLLIAFIVLKLCHVIDWSWWWVLSPFWIPLGIVVICLAIYAIGLWMKSIDRKKRLASGMNEWAWKRRKENKNLPDTTPRPMSKWEERMEEMKRKQQNR